MEIVLVRHAQPEWIREGLAVDDPPLTDRGRRQARLLAERLAAEHFDEIYVSPLTRALQTFEPVGHRTGWQGETARWLEEIRSPIWHGSPAEKAEETFRAERLRPAEERWSGIPGGEAVRDFVARIRESAGLFLEEHGITPAPGELPVWRIEDPGRRILLVAHAGTNAVTMCYLLGLQPVPWEWERFVLGHASISRLEALELGDGHTFSLTRLSDSEHLPTILRTR